MADKPRHYDVAVIGGGPAGMIAAGRAAECGANVILIEKNPKLGKKLLITGGGRCNIANAEFDDKKLVAKYGKKGKALFGSFSRFGVEEVFDFFESRGLPLKIEAENRAFPKSDKASDVWLVLLAYLKEQKVKIAYNTPVKGLQVKNGKIAGVITPAGIITADNYIIATGGKSRPETGSTGEGFEWMKKIGHTVDESDPALVPMTVAEQWLKDLSGLSFASAGLSLFQDGKKQHAQKGKLLFTHFGLSGPLALNMSKGASELFKYAPVELQVDIFPNLQAEDLDAKLLETIGDALNKKARNAFGALIAPRLIPTTLAHAGIDPEKDARDITRAERLRIGTFLKAMPLTVTGFLGVEKAIVTSGGVSLDEIDFKTMRSKIYPNLFLAGDILNFDRPSGGFSLQICWTTGYLAGENSAKK